MKTEVLLNRVVALALCFYLFFLCFVHIDIFIFVALYGLEFWFCIYINLVLPFLFLSLQNIGILG